MAGAPKGNKNAAKSKLFDAALRRYLTQNPDDLRIAVEKFVGMAKAGELPAIRELADRLDGKPAQSMEISGGLETSKDVRDLTDDELAAEASSLRAALGINGAGASTASGPQSLN